jgi:ER-bound oxygenase mpaB/B'/Rubber oxygenase, catalytic domain
MKRPPILEQIRALDPERDHERIVFLCTCYEFPFDTTRSLEFALFRTFCVPRIANLLDGTGEFRNRAQKRYDDTDIIISELMEHGYSSERGRRALARMNQQHGQFRIANDDFRYVLSTFIYEPIRWNTKFGWRRMCETERLAFFHFWRKVGELMGIEDIPADYDVFERYNIDYEKRHFRSTEASRRVGAATIEIFASWFPRFLRPLVRRSMYAIMDDPVIAGFGFPKPSPSMRAFVTAVLRLRARLLRLMPARRHPRLRTEMKHRSHPDGYRIEDLGPPIAGSRQRVGG